MARCKRCRFLPCRCKDLRDGLAYSGVEKCRASNPKESLALKVHRKQIPAAMERARKHGVPTNYTADGKPIITSRAHQKALLKLENSFKPKEDHLFNQDGGYGD